MALHCNVNVLYHICISLLEQLRIQRLEQYEAQERPNLEQQRKFVLLSTLCDQELHWREQVEIEVCTTPSPPSPQPQESTSRTAVRKNGYASWEQQFKNEKRRHECEKLERKEFEGIEAAARVAVKEDEYLVYLVVVTQAEESWEVVDRIMQQRAAREEEEKRRIALKLAEEDRENQWKREKQQKEDERLNAERHLKREAQAKEEKKLRAVGKKAEEVSRALLRELFEIDLKLSTHACQLSTAMEVRNTLLSIHPSCKLTFTEDYMVPFFEGVSEKVNISPTETTMDIYLPDDWTAKMEASERTIYKYARQESIARVEHRSACRRLQENYNVNITAAGLAASDLERPNEHRTADYISNLVDFPPVRSVLEEKTRVWGGSVACSVESSGTGPSLACDVLFIEDTKFDCADGQKNCPSNQVEVALKDRGSVNPEEICNLLNSIQYVCPTESSPFVRNVRYVVRVEVNTITNTYGWAVREASEGVENVSVPASPTLGMALCVPLSAEDDALTEDYDDDFATEAGDSPTAASPASPSIMSDPAFELHTSHSSNNVHNKKDDKAKYTAELERVKDLFSYPRDSNRVPSTERPFVRNRTVLQDTCSTFIGFQRPYLRFSLDSQCPHVTPVEPKERGTDPQLSSILQELKKHNLVGKSEGLSVKPPTILQYDYFDLDHTPVALTPFAVDVEMPATYLFEGSQKDGTRTAILQTEGLPKTFEGGILSISFERGYTIKDSVLVSVGGHLSIDADTQTLFLDDAEFGTALTPLKPWASNASILHYKPVVPDDGQMGRNGRNINPELPPASATSPVEVLRIKFTRSVSKFKLKSLLQQLFYCNNSKDPLVGKRVLQISVSDSSSLKCSVTLHVNVKWSDTPTRLQVDDTKLSFKSPCRSDLSEHHLPFIEKSVLPIMLQARLIDPDTDRFCGGFLVMTLQQGTDSDGLFIQCSPSPDIGISTQETTTTPPSTPMTRTYTILFNGDVFASASFLSGENGETEEISVDFATDGNASITATECLLRSICFFSTESINIPMGSRVVDVSILIGPTMLKYDVDGKPVDYGPSVNQPISTSINIKVSPPLIKIAQKHVSMKYLEGSGVKRLGPFELCTDEENCGKDWSGFMKAEIADGCEDGDVICLKEEYGLKLALLSEAVEIVEVTSDCRRRRSSTDASHFTALAQSGSDTTLERPSVCPSSTHSSNSSQQTDQSPEGSPLEVPEDTGKQVWKM